jgi:hypothetical protein
LVENRRYLDEPIENELHVDKIYFGNAAIIPERHNNISCKKVPWCRTYALLFEQNVKHYRLAFTKDYL